uniref:G-protein coupled receptors family 1 profile domain-containing protein n=1 Tax=Acrobeloides nanus TaxID=290746 RepID=A0A914DMU1_9BILA
MVVYYAYIAVGMVAISTNLLLISIYLSSKRLLMRFILFVGLASADLINGCAFVWTGKTKKSSLKPFFGDPGEWDEFWDIYRSTIHENPSLSLVEKLIQIKALF